MLCSRNLDVKILIGELQTHNKLYRRKQQPPGDSAAHPRLTASRTKLPLRFAQADRCPGQVTLTGDWVRQVGMIRQHSRARGCNWHKPRYMLTCPHLRSVLFYNDRLGCNHFEDHYINNNADLYRQLPRAAWVHEKTLRQKGLCQGHVQRTRL